MWDREQEGLGGRLPGHLLGRRGGRDPSCSQQHRSQGMSFPPAAREICPVTQLIHICHHGKKFPWSLANQPRMRVPATSPLTGGMCGKGTPSVARGLPASTVTLDAEFLPPVFKCDAYPVARAVLVNSPPQFLPFHRLWRRLSAPSSPQMLFAVSSSGVRGPG